MARDWHCPTPATFFLVYPNTPLQPRRDTSIAGLSLGTFQPDKCHHCPHSHVSPSEDASLGLSGPCRRVHGGVSGAMCCSLGAPHIWNVCAADLISYCSGPSWDTVASFSCSCREAGLRHQQWLLSPTILPETMEVTALDALRERGTHS